MEHDGAADFSFDLDRERKLLKIMFRGQWDLETVERYSVARADAIRSATVAGISSDELVLLVDRRPQPVQTQEVVEAVGRAVRDNGSLARKTAILVTSALHARQIKRTAPSASVRIFENEAEAVAWLQSRE